MSGPRVTSTIKEVDRGAKELIKRVGQNIGIDIGIIGAQAGRRYGDGGKATVADIAGFHEFGTKTIPQRSFLVGWFDKDKAKHTQFLKTLTAKFLEHKITDKQFVTLAGEYAVGGIQKYIAGKIPPPLAASTLWRRWGRKKVTVGIGPRNAKVKPSKIRKGGKPKRVFGDTPLIDTGLLRSSITYRLYKP